MTAFQQHVANWRECKKCPLWKGRSRVVFTRGRVPCDVMFLGEAPGVSEDVIGQPFVGPAGKLADSIVARALPPGVTFAFYNLVGCFPKEEKANGDDEPPSESIVACAPRLQEFVKIANPKLIVCVGALARDWLDVKRRHHVALHREIPVVDITHPAHILRQNHAMQGLAIQRCVVTIANAIGEMT